MEIDLWHQGKSSWDKCMGWMVDSIHLLRICTMYNCTCVYVCLCIGHFIECQSQFADSCEVPDFRYTIFVNIQIVLPLLAAVGQVGDFYFLSDKALAMHAKKTNLCVW